jgi:ATP-dependent exoDNAse (exonuclease V) beta subunit
MKSFTHRPLTTPLPELSTVTVHGKRFYDTQTSLYPSVTTVLSVLNKEHIDKWRESVGEEEATRISEHAANRGTHLHSALEDYLQNRPVQFPLDTKSKVKIMFNRLRRILEDVDNIVAQEVPLFSAALTVAGRCDCIAEYKGKLSVLDFKSTTKAKKKDWILAYFLQATAYSLMFEELTGLKAEQIVIIISGEEDFSSQVFVEDRGNYIETLKGVIDKFYTQEMQHNDSYQRA